MMLDTLIKNIQTIIDSIVIKYDNEAKKYDTIEFIMDADQYVAAKLNSDTFFDYSEFPMEVLEDAGMMSIVDTYMDLYPYASNPSTIPKEFRQKVVESNRKYIINNYDDGNDYYRMYNGLPNIQEPLSELITLTQQQKLIAGIESNGYIHELPASDIFRLQEYGILDEIISSHPDKKYLNFLGDNKIEFHIARMTKNFDILKIKKGDLSDEFFNSFIRIYDQNREYFVTTIYNKDYASRYDFYDRFIGLCIMVMTIQRLVSNAFKFGINRDFYDWDFIRKLYGTYNIPFIENLPIEYQMLLLKNMNNLLRYKSTDKAIFDICSLLGYDRINIFKYYLVKKHKLDSNEEPIFYYKQKLDDSGDPILNDDNEPEYEIDFEKTYDIYFQGVDIREKNLLLALQDTNKIISYNEMIESDPYWWEDDALHKLKYENVYNHVETKFLSMNMIYKMTEMLFEVTYFFRSIISNKDSMTKILIDIPRVYSGVDFDLFHVVIFLVASMCKLHGFTDYTITTPSMISHIYGFNFDEESIEYIKQIVTDNKTKVDQSTLKYFEELEIKNANDVNDVYGKIRELNEFLIDKMRNAKTIEEYRIYQTIFRTAMISDVSTDMFTVYDYDTDGNATARVATSYLEYLQYAQPILAEIIEDTEPENISIYINHVIIRLEAYVDNLKYLFIVNDSTDNPVYISLIKLLKFFKSYTVDLNTFNIVYIFDSPYYNKLNLIDQIDLITKTYDFKDFMKQYYNDIVRVSAKLKKSDKDLSNMKDKLNSDTDVRFYDGYYHNTILRDTVKITITGDPGEDGISPTAVVEQTSTGSNITITDESGTTTASITNGISPTAVVEQTPTGATITITDVSGTTTTNIPNGDDAPTTTSEVYIGDDEPTDPNVKIWITSDEANDSNPYVTQNDVEEIVQNIISGSSDTSQSN